MIRRGWSRAASHERAPRQRMAKTGPDHIHLTSRSSSLFPFLQFLIHQAPLHHQHSPHESLLREYYRVVIRLLGIIETYPDDPNSRSVVLPISLYWLSLSDVEN
ncbi:MAG: hypothetical protein Q9169_004376 [Polycauliona sp. 2 TL-2023]